MSEGEKIFRRMLWLSHGHTGMYGDDGEMQCGECLKEYGFWDWKNTSAKEIEEKITAANIIKYNINKKKIYRSTKVD